MRDNTVSSRPRRYAAPEGNGAGAPGAARTAAADEEAWQRERSDLNDRLLRSAAEFDNYRKRVERERREWSDATTMDVVRELLPAIDDLERALAATGGPADALRRGVDLTHQKMIEALKRRGVEPFDPLGADFDPNVHEAVAYEPAPGHRDGEVIGVLQRGYMLRDRLVRPAAVKVAKA